MGYPGHVLVTGTSTGIGKATALYLDRLGFQVFAGVRKESDGEVLRAAASERLVPLYLDVTNGDTIARARESVARSVGDAGLAGLVNNAGIGFSCPLEFAPLDDLRALFETNVFGLLAVTQAFLPLLRQARGRLINISSTATLIVIPFHGPYSASKLCVNGFSDALRLELKPFGIQVSALVVGSMNTPIWDKATLRSEKIGRTQPLEADELYGKPFGRFRDYMQDLGQNGASPETVARVVAGALTARRARPYYMVGQDAQRIGFLKRIIPERFRDDIVLKTIGIEG